MTPIDIKAARAVCELTAETITDEDIRALDAARWREPLLPVAPGRGRIGDLCAIALSTAHHESRMNARAKCAELINAALRQEADRG